MPKFFFDPALSPSDNIERFYKHLAGINPEFAALLRRYLPDVIPLPQQPQQRAARRSAFNAAISRSLDQSECGAVPRDGGTK